MWGLALAFGLYRITDIAWIFAAGVAVAVFHGFSRANSSLQGDLPREFQQRIKSLAAEGHFEDVAETRAGTDHLIIRVFDKAELWLRNGKVFNLLVLLCALVDCVLLWTGHAGWGVFVLLVGAGVASPVLMVYVIARTISTRRLIRTALISK